MGSLASFPYLPAVASNANILSEADWASASDSLTQLVVGSGCCNEEQLTQLDFGCFTELRSVRVGCYCCVHVNEVKLIGLQHLESVVVGVKSFYMGENRKGDIPLQCFYLKDCPKVRELRIGDRSFRDYAVCVIENVDALEVIETNAAPFYYASLELKSTLIHSRR